MSSGGGEGKEHARLKKYIEALRTPRSYESFKQEVRISVGF